MNPVVNTKELPLLAFIKSVKVELAQVKWPTHQETLRLTTVVILGSLTVGLYVGGLDSMFIKLLTELINR